VGANPERDELLRAFVAADLALRPKRERFRVQRIESHAGPLLSHSGFGEGEPPDCTLQDLDDLHEQGLIRLKKEKRSVRRGRSVQTYWEEWFFDVTVAGFERVELEHRAAEAERGPNESGTGGYGWETEVLPVLEAFYTASGSADADLGVSDNAVNEVLGREPGDARTDRVVTMLVSTGYLDTTVRSMGFRYCRITEKGLQITAGWPSGAADAAYTRLLTLIDKHVEEAATDEERSKWERLRDGVVGVGRDVAVDVLSAVAQTGLRHTGI
jgi:hypothetical protein